LIFIDGFGNAAFEILQNWKIASGITTNTTILKREGYSFTKAVSILRNLPGTHFVQISLRGMDWKRVLEDLDEKGKFVVKVVWKLPEAIEIAGILHDMGMRVCATAVYDSAQVLAAKEAEVEWVAIYYDRMIRAGMEPKKLIGFSVAQGMRVIVASLKGKRQIEDAVKSGAQDITLPPDVFLEYFSIEFPHDDFEKFEEDYEL